jgi:hypothetical protein
VSQDGVVPLHLSGDQAGIGIEEELGWVATRTLPRIPRTVDAKPVPLTYDGVRNRASPDRIAARSKLDTPLGRGRVEKAQFDSVCDAAVDGGL